MGPNIYETIGHEYLYGIYNKCWDNPTHSKIIIKKCNVNDLKYDVNDLKSKINDRSITPRRILKNGPATIVFWEDNTKTVVMRKKGEKDDPYYAFCAALAKKVYSNNSRIKKLLDNCLIDETKKSNKK